MVQFSKNKITLSSLWISSHDRPSDFYASCLQRGDSPVPLLIIRLFLAALTVSFLVWSLVDAGPTPYWLIYLTNWGLLLLNFMTLSGVLVSAISVRKGHCIDSDALPWYISTYWLFYNLTVSTAILITCLYWLLLFDPAVAEEQPRREFWLDVSTHAFNSCIVVVTVLTTLTPTRPLHVCQPLGVGLWYAAFSAIYYAAGGTDANGNPYIYDVLDWRQGARTGAVIGASCGGLLAIYAMLWALALCRDTLTTALFRTRSLDLPSTPSEDSRGIV